LNAHFNGIQPKEGVVMAEVKVNKGQEREQERGESQKTQQPARSEQRLARRGSFSPSLWNDPGELFRMGPFGMMRRMQQEMDRMMSGFWSGGEEGAWSPALEVKERDGKMIVCAELPGLKKDDVKVEVTDDAVIIEGERRQEQEEKREGFYRSERSYGSFHRAVPLPEHVNADEARATFENGVLEVSIPVAEEKRRSRHIPIETAGGGRKPAAGESASTAGERKAG
jgi:HSP20 family protein